MSNTDRCPYFRSSASSAGGKLPWPSVARGPSLNFTSQARGPLTSRRCKHPGGGLRVYPALKPTASGLLSYALRPVTTSNAPSAMSYRNCWHIFGPRLSGPHAWSGAPVGGCLVRENACSSLRSLTKIPHCCLWRGPLRPQVAGRPQSPARDRWLNLTPNPTWGHPYPAAAWWPQPPAVRRRGPANPHALRTLAPPPPGPAGRGQTGMCQASRAHSLRTIVIFIDLLAKLREGGTRPHSGRPLGTGKGGSAAAALSPGLSPGRVSPPHWSGVAPGWRRRCPARFSCVQRLGGSGVGLRPAHWHNRSPSARLRGLLSYDHTLRHSHPTRSR